MAIRLDAALQQHIFSQMEAAFPNEGGGFLLGEHQDGDVIIRGVVQVENVFETEEQYHRYAMTPENWMHMEDEADERGLMLVGYYHSHPDSPSNPSEYDREHALPNFVYIITSVRGGVAADITAWLLRDDRTRFDPAELIVTD